MRHGIPTCTEPKDPKSLYMYNLYHEFFWGPFENEQSLIEAINTLDEADPYWDYDPFCILYGADPLPAHFTRDFPTIDNIMKKRILNSRKRK